MKIANTFTVNVPIGQAWDVLCDLERVIPLMPGAQFTGHEGEDYLGKVKVKVGPVTSEFNGKVRFVEQDAGQHRAVFDAKGKEARGTGNAAATVTAQLQQAGEHTDVTVETDLKIVGKLAQFGSGMLQQVSEKLLGQFVESLEAELAAENSSAEPAEPAESAEQAKSAEPAGSVLISSNGHPQSAPPASKEPEAIDLLELAGGDQLKKYGAAAAAALAVLLLIWLLRRR